jgi:hypothetical protein
MLYAFSSDFLLALLSNLFGLPSRILRAVEPLDGVVRIREVER